MNLGFREIGTELKEAIEDATNIGTPKVTLTVAKPFCSPARSVILKALEPYGVKVYDIRERVISISIKDFARRMKIETKTWENLKYGPASIAFLPSAIEARVRVKRKQARWAEYLMLRTGRLYVPGKYFDPRNEEWATKHGDRMPPTWNGGAPWIEKSCKDGNNNWREVQQQFRKMRKQSTKPAMRKKRWGVMNF